jgi:SAM-dependent methyltransferase
MPRLILKDFNQYPVNKNLETYEVDTPDFWNKIYKEKTPAWGYAPARLLTTFAQYFPDKGSILDIGCGSGRNSLFLANLGFKVTGVDISQDAINEARSYNNKNCSFICASLIEMWPNESFDVIIDFGLFHFIPPEYRDKYISNIKNSLNENGVYINQSGRLVKESPMGTEQYTPPQFELSEMQKWFTNFDIVELIADELPKIETAPSSYPCWNMVARKR